MNIRSVILRNLSDTFYYEQIMENQNPIVDIQAWTAMLMESVRRVATQILEYLPAVLGAIVLLLIGWGVARLLRYATQKLAGKMVDRLAHTRPMDTRVQQPHAYNAAPTIASRIVFWIVLLFFVLAASELLELKVVSDLIGSITGYLPHLLTGLLMLFIGLWLAEVTRAVIRRTGTSNGIEQSDVLGRLGQILVLLVVFSMAAGQVGIDNTLLVILVAVFFAVTLGAVAMAFSIGAKTTIANLLAAQSIAQAYSQGDYIRIGEIEGKILRITRTSLILETTEGQTLIPAKRFSEQDSVLIANNIST